VAVRTALLGCGRIARLSHLANLTSNPDAELVAIADIEPSALAAASALAPRAEPFTDLRRLFDVAKPDAVVIALPTRWHSDGIHAALESGAHTYLEKPIAADLDEARPMHDAWKKTNLTGRMGFNARFNPLYATLRESLNRGSIGSAVAVRSSFTALFPSDATWRLSAATGGGALLELVSHHVDLLRFVFDSEIATVSASQWSNRGNDEAVMLHLTLTNGVNAQIFAAFGTIEEDSFEIYGTDGKLRINRYDSLIVEHIAPRASGGLASAALRLKREVRAIPYGLRKRRSPGQEPSFASSLGAFISAVHTGTSATPDLTDGLRALEVIEAGRHSIESGCTVALR
jgi:myo-inositol 2-dehydrogenase/D-chiro-inositol 1-dehydrogenase